MASESSREEEEEVCAICREPMVGEGAVALDPCGHRLHGRCAVAWFRSPGSLGQCPLCRATPDVEFIPNRSLAERGTMVRNAARRKDAPPRLRRLVAALRDAEQRERDAASALAAAKRDETYRAAMKKVREISRRRWRLRALVRRMVALYDDASPGVAPPRRSRTTSPTRGVSFGAA